MIQEVKWILLSQDQPKIFQHVLFCTIHDVVFEGLIDGVGRYRTTDLTQGPFSERDKQEIIAWMPKPLGVKALQNQ